MSPGGLTSVASGCAGLDDEPLAGALDDDGDDGAELGEVPDEAAFVGLDEPQATSTVEAASAATAGNVVLKIAFVLIK